MIISWNSGVVVAMGQGIILQESIGGVPAGDTVPDQDEVSERTKIMFLIMNNY